ncbi:hypothetical protein J4216_02295 [Candidatus Woesearchaeota archaeon]|nr:hypothetical protein [Candidatus Woesearchaeota archaeon]
MSEEEKFDLRKEYGKLRNKYKDLPSFDDLSKDFEITTIDKEDFLIRRVRRRINEKVVFFCRILENIIYPSMQNALSAYEANFFTDDEKQKLSDIHKELMVIERESIYLDVEASDDEKNIQFIVKTFKRWEHFKNEIQATVMKMIDTWKNEQKKEEGERYFG